MIGYRVLDVGLRPLRKVRLVRVAPSLRLAPFQRAEIEVVRRRLQGSGRRIWPGPLYHLSSFHATDRLVLCVGTTDYLVAVAMHEYSKSWAKCLGEESLPRPIAISVLTLTRDQKLVMERRSRLVAEYPGKFHVRPSGHPEPPETLRQSIARESGEELGIKPSEVSELCYLGMVQNMENGKVEVICSQRTRLSLEEVRSRQPSSEWESEEQIGIPATPRGIRKMVRAHSREICVPGMAALAIALRAYEGSSAVSR